MLNGRQASLEEWFRQGKYMPYHSHAIFYREGGVITDDAEVLLFLHGFPTASYDWKTLWPALQHDFHLIAPDFIGFGFSAKPVHYEYSVADQADMVEELLARLGVSRCHILAHDFGVTVAQELLARANRRAEAGEPQGVRLKSVMLLNAGIFPEAHRALMTQKMLAGPLGGYLARQFSESRFAKSMTDIFGRETPPSLDDLTAMWRLLDHNQGRRVLPKLIGYMAERKKNRQRWVGALKNPVAPPLRFVVGEADPISGAHMADRYQEQVPDADIVRLDKIGHYPQVEDSARVLRAFVDFHQALRDGDKPGTKTPQKETEAA